MVVSCSTLAPGLTGLATRLTGLALAAAMATGMAAGAQTAINQFSDVRPGDWAYQALANLIERHGCVAGDPDGAYRGPRALTRYEAAALLNSCLERVTAVTDELKALLKDFAPELAVIRGRVDSLDATVAELEASVFSTTPNSGVAPRLWWAPTPSAARPSTRAPTP